MQVSNLLEKSALQMFYEEGNAISVFVTPHGHTSKYSGERECKQKVCLQENSTGPSINL